MLALLKTDAGPGHVELADIPEPVCGDGMVKIRVEATGICGSDLHVVHGDVGVKVPSVLGHEIAGTIVQTAPGVTGVAVGDRVAVLNSAVNACGTCLWCRVGQYCLCPQRTGLSGIANNGGFAAYCVIPERLAYPLPAHVDSLIGSMCEPLACCVRAVDEIAQIQDGQTALITGPGPIGLLTQLVVQALGGRAYVCGTSGDAVRLETARELGALTEHPTAVDHVFECSGAADALGAYLPRIRPGGTFIQVGVPPAGDLVVDMRLAMMREIQIRTSYGHTWRSWETTMRLLETKQVDPSPLVSDVLPLTQWREGFDRAEQRRALKVVLQP